MSAVADPIAADPSPRKLGLWLYLMSDLMVFASLFATFMILRHATNGHPPGAELFDLTFVLIETMLLLVSSFACGVAYLALKHKKLKHFWAYFAILMLCGVGFLGMEIYEFVQLYTEGHDWTVSAFMSAFYTLVGVHGFHILMGLVWAGVLVWLVLKRGATTRVVQRFGLFSIYWHFLDLVWIFIFSVVYLLGAIG